MKKILTLTLAFLIASGTVFASEYTKFSRKFMKHIRDCDSYEETVNSNFQDMDFKTDRKIHGWENGLCKYTEIITSARGVYKLECGFNEAQLDDLYEAMKDRSKKTEKTALDIFYQKTNTKTGEIEYVRSGITEIKGNKAYIVWAKYQNNPYICAPSEITPVIKHIGEKID